MSVNIRTPIKYSKLIEIEYYWKPWPYTLPHTKEGNKKFLGVLKVRLVKYVGGVSLGIEESFHYLPTWK